MRGRPGSHVIDRRRPPTGPSWPVARVGAARRQSRGTIAARRRSPPLLNGNALAGARRSATASERSASSSRASRSPASRSSSSGCTERGFAVTQATVSRDIAELGLVKAPRLRRPCLRPARDAHRRRPGAGRRPVAGVPTSASAGSSRDVPVTIGRSGLILLVTGLAGHRQHHRPGDRRVLAHGAGGHARGRQYAARPVRRRGAPRRLARALRRHPMPRPRPQCIPLGGRSPHEEGRPRLLRRPRHVRRRRLAAREVRLRGRLPDGRCRRRLAPRGRRAAGDQRRRVARVRRRCPRAVRPRLRLAAPPGERAVPGRLSAGDGAGPAADRPAPRRGRAASRAPTPSPTAAPARATTRSASTSRSTPSIRASRSSPRCGSGWA